MCFKCVQLNMRAVQLMGAVLLGAVGRVCKVCAAAFGHAPAASPALHTDHFVCFGGILLTYG